MCLNEKSLPFLQWNFTHWYATSTEKLTDDYRVLISPRRVLERPSFCSLVWLHCWKLILGTFNVHNLRWMTHTYVSFSFPDIATAHPDKKSILMYVTSLFQVLPQKVSIESFRELDTLPRQIIPPEEQVRHFDQRHFSQQVWRVFFPL